MDPSDANASSYTDGFRRTLCPICGDFANGFHYGIWTCESCKCFFRRSIQNNVKVDCDENCDVNVETRKQCPACRLAKCIEKGMKKELVRENRVRGGRYRQKPQPDGN